MMAALACPQCGNELSYASPALPVKVCDRCRSLVLRKDQQLERVGEAAVLPFDVSPVQIMTTGRFNGMGFTVLGRIRWGWAEGSWNEWLVLFDDNTSGWLGEAMGDFMLLREQPIDLWGDSSLAKLVAGENPPIGERVDIGGVTYSVTDIKQATVLASEGDLPFKATGDWTIDSIDFRSTTSACASFQRDEDGSSFYAGDALSLSDLQLKNLRAIDGWKVPA
jgi:Domain of unknown function (DUF4178)